MLLISIFILRMVTESDETHKSVAYSDMQKAWCHQRIALKEKKMERSNEWILV
jgi:hypothetical protein